MKKLSILVLALACLVDFSGCESTRYAPPPVTVELLRSSGSKTVDLAMLGEGRSLFVHRCIECHTLPSFWHYKTDDWPEVVDTMRRRAHLEPRERDAIIAYILAVRRR
jgi:hypothetical protein